MATRREFLTAVAAFTGASGAYTAARAMGLMEGEPDEVWRGPPALSPGSGRGARVVILGGGVGGLAAAYELGKAGYACTLLEARGRVGGRNHTIRRDSKLEMTDGTRQVCTFDEGLYFNAGPARLPTHHQATLGYCRELGVPIETLVNHCASALIQSDTMNGGAPIQMRQAAYDTRGHAAELLSKAIRNGGLDKEMSAQDLERLTDTLTSWGALSTNGKLSAPPAPWKLRGSPASAKAEDGDSDVGESSDGWIRPPGAGSQTAIGRKPLPISTLMNPIVGLGSTFHELIDMQATMLQPVGGMDQIPLAFERALGPVVQKGCVVTGIRRAGAGVAVTFRDPAGAPQRVEADYCIVNIPLSVLKDIPSDFSADRQAAISGARYRNAIKVAFQSPRFWEREDRIYGGLSFTDRDTFITWYPSGKFHAPTGVLVAGYAFGEQADRFGALPLADRFSYARGTVERLHPGRSSLLSAPITVTWKNVPYNLGIECPLGEQNPAAYALLSRPDGPFFFCGEHLSHVGAWQQGAFLSAHHAIKQLDAQHRGGAPVTDVRLQ